MLNSIKRLEKIETIKKHFRAISNSVRYQLTKVCEEKTSSNRLAKKKREKKSFDGESWRIPDVIFFQCRRKARARVENVLSSAVHIQVST